MNEERKLIYEERKSLDDFRIKVQGSLNNLIYYNWLSKKTEIDPFGENYKAKYLKAFNDAYYLCTLTLMSPVGMDINNDYIIKPIEIPSVVFPLVRFYLSRLNGSTLAIKHFLDSIETKCKKEADWGQNYIDLQEALEEYNGSVDASVSAQRKLTKDVLSDIKWHELTSSFEKKRIEIVVKFYARERDAWNLMCEAIKAAAISFDYELGFEEIEQEGWYEDGPYTQIVKVSRDQYDCDGNDLSDPLKRAGVYDFCDKLMDKYDELSLDLQTMAMNSTDSFETIQIPETVTASNKGKWDDSLDDVFDYKLNVQAIAKAFSAFNNSELTVKQKAYVLFRIFEEMSWIPKKRGSQIKFIEWYSKHFNGWKKNNFGSDFSMFTNILTSEWSRVNTPHPKLGLFKEMLDFARETFWEINGNNELSDKSKFIKEGMRCINP